MSDDYLADLSSKVQINSNDDLLSFSAVNIKIEENVDVPPRRSSHLVGWKVETTPKEKDVNRVGDKFGPFKLARPKRTAEESLNWPPGSCH